MRDLADLLAVQELDTTLDQLRHRLATHPLRAEIRQVQAEAARLGAELAAADATRTDLLRQQKRWDDEVATVAARRAEIDGQLYGGTVTSPKELVALQADADSLLRRQTDLEDRELEVMEQVEEATGIADGIRAQLATVEERLEDRRQQLTAATAELEVELERVTAERVGAVAPIDAELLRRYDALRAQSGGVAVARLNGATCEGCHLTLSAVTVDQLKKLPADEVARCDECGRMLTR